MTKLIVYIAGKITGDPNFKRKFAKAKQDIHKVLKDEYDTVIITPSEFPQGLTNTDYMRFAFASIDAADFIIFLPDWQDSAGACLERAYIRYTEQEYKLTEAAFKKGKHERRRRGGCAGSKARKVDMSYKRHLSCGEYDGMQFMPQRARPRVCR